METVTIGMMVTGLARLMQAHTGWNRAMKVECSMQDSGTDPGGTSNTIITGIAITAGATIATITGKHQNI